MLLTQFTYLYKGTSSRFKLSNLFSFNIISSISFSIQSSYKITSSYKKYYQFVLFHLHFVNGSTKLLQRCYLSSNVNKKKVQSWLNKLSWPFLNPQTQTDFWLLFHLAKHFLAMQGKSLKSVGVQWQSAFAGLCTLKRLLPF